VNTGGGSDSQKEDVELETGCPGVVESVFARDCRKESKFGKTSLVNGDTVGPIV